MATTVVPKYDKPIVVTMEELREVTQDMLERVRGDEDKAGEMEDCIYYEGFADALESTLKFITGTEEKKD